MRSILPLLPLIALWTAPLLRGQVSWEKVSIIENRGYHAMAPDLAGGGMLLFGGMDGSFRGDTWRFDGADWHPLTPSAAPMPRSGFAMAADLGRGRIVLFGGNAGGPQNDTWEWDGTDWLARTPSTPPAARAAHVLAYDPKSERVLLPQGTFLYGPVNAATVTRFGHGCPGSAGVPALAPRDGSRPWLGDTLHLALTGLPASGSAAACLGQSNQSWAGVSLPLELTPIGMPGCHLLVSAEVFLLLVNVSGTAGLDLPIPNAPQFVGAAVYAQALAFEPPANAFGVTTSNGCFALIGSR